MKKRIRKKHHLREFTIFGFELSLEPTSREQQVIDSLGHAVMDLVEQQGWECYGFSLDCLFLFEGKPGLGLPDAKDAFLSAVKALPQVATVKAGETVDAWKALHSHCDCGCEDEDCDCEDKTCTCHHHHHE
ncbi:MAG: DUF469 family protein [Victivallales bacterium]|nr:DUF469 family protein [Victivallales bacterium]